MTPFEKVYNRLFMLRPADTKHMNDCELVWRAAQDDHEAAVRAAVAAERTKVWGDLIRRFNDRDRRRIAGNFAHDWTVTSLTMESRFRADLVETFAATLPKAEALAQLDAEKNARKEQT